MEMKNARNCCSEILVSKLGFAGQLGLCKISIREWNSVSILNFPQLFTSNSDSLYLQSADYPCSPNFVLFLVGFCDSSCSSASLTTALALIPLPTSCLFLGALLSHPTLVLTSVILQTCSVLYVRANIHEVYFP